MGPFLFLCNNSSEISLTFGLVPVFLSFFSFSLSLSNSLLSGLSQCPSPSRSEGYPPYGFQPMGSAPAADPAPTWLDAPHPPLHSGPPSLHLPITRVLHRLGGTVDQWAGSVPSGWPQGKKKKKLAVFFIFS